MYGENNNYDYAIFKLDRTNLLLYLYSVIDGMYIDELEEPLSYRFGEPILEEVEINIDNSNTTEILPQGTETAYLNGNIVAYLNNNKVYGLNFRSGNYMVADLVTDESKIAEIENGIASIE